MNIGIIGAGNIGGTLAALLTHAGHQVALSNSRGPASLADTVRTLGPNARATTTDDAASFGEVVIVAIPFKDAPTLPAARLHGKIVVDTTNYYPQRNGQIDLSGDASTEFVARHLVGARLVKAFNTVAAARLRDEGDTVAPVDDRPAVLIAADDADAKATVARLIEEIGFAPVDTGSLHDSTRQQPGAALLQSAHNRQRGPHRARIVALKAAGAEFSGFVVRLARLRGRTMPRMQEE